jgi:uncharacterized protein YceK
MKEVALLLLIALTLNGCSSTTTNTAATTASGSWQAQTSGGAADASGFSFITNFTVDGSGHLGITFFQFLNTSTCFVSGQSESGTLIVTTNSNNVVTGTLVFTVQSGTPAGNTLTLNGTESGNTITGTWQAAGSSDCTSAGTFTMTQS